MARLKLYELELQGYFKLIDFNHNGKPGIEIYPQDFWSKITSCWKAAGFSLTVGKRRIMCNKKSLDDFLGRYLGKAVDVESFSNKKIMKLIYQVENRARRRTKGLWQFINHCTPFRHTLTKQASSVDIKDGSITTLLQISSRRAPLCELICDPSVDRKAARGAARLLLAKIAGISSPLSDKEYKRTTDLLRETITCQIKERADAQDLHALVDRLITHGR